MLSTLLMKPERVIDSVATFQVHNFIWWALGHATNSQSILGGFRDLLLSICITIIYPLHLLIGLFMSETKVEIINNLLIILAVLPCGIKLCCYRLKLKEIQKAKAILAELDKSVQGPLECQYFRETLLRRANRTSRIFAILYPFALLVSLIQYAMSGQKRLMYAGWFPFDWRSSTFRFSCAVLYQIIGVVVEGFQNLTNDLYPPLVLGLLADHMHLLNIRASNLGNDANKGEAKYQRDLIGCIQDYKLLMSLYSSIGSTISMALFAQFLTSAVCVSVSVISMAFYTDNLYFYIYHVLLLTAYLGELFPPCYYGTLAVSEFAELPYAIFSGNWIERQSSYRKSIIILIEQSMPTKRLFVGGMIGLDVNTFFATVKMAYSIFTLIKQLN